MLDFTKKYEMSSVYLLKRCVFREDLNKEIDVEYLTVCNIVQNKEDDDCGYSYWKKG